MNKLFYVHRKLGMYDIGISTHTKIRKESVIWWHVNTRVWLCIYKQTNYFRIDLSRFILGAHAHNFQIMTTTISIIVIAFRLYCNWSLHSALSRRLSKTKLGSVEHFSISNIKKLSDFLGELCKNCKLQKLPCRAHCTAHSYVTRTGFDTCERSKHVRAQPERTRQIWSPRSWTTQYSWESTSPGSYLAGT